MPHSFNAGLTGRGPGLHEAVQRVIVPSVSAEPVADGSSTARQLDTNRLPDHLDRLFRAAYALCGSRHEAEDLVQETYARVLRRPRFVRHEDDLVYLLRALRNTWVSQLRSAESRQSIPSEPDELEWVTDSRSDPPAALDAQATYAAVAELSPRLRQAIVAVDVVGLSYKEAARALRVPKGTIMSRLSRAREAVAESVGREEAG